jgi:hypothetical protein
MSLFYAFHTPMMKTVIDTTTMYVNRQGGSNVTDCLAAVTGVCYHTITKRRVQQPEAVGFVLRVMVATTLLYDHIHPQGAFIKSSPINIKKIITAVQNENHRQSQSLVNALKYSNRHLNDETTPKSVRQMLA